MIESSTLKLFCCKAVDFKVISFNNSFAVLSLYKRFPLLELTAILFTVAYLTLKNSSRLLEKIPKNLILSINGTKELLASSKTLSLNSSQLNSRFTNIFF